MTGDSFECSYFIGAGELVPTMVGLVKLGLWHRVNSEHMVGLCLLDMAVSSIWIRMVMLPTFERSRRIGTYGGWLS